MKITTIAKLQKSGRIRVGIAFARMLGLQSGQKLYYYLVQSPLNKNKKGVLLSLFKISKSMGCISALLKEEEGALAKITGSLSEIGVDFVYSNDRDIIKNERFHWEAVADFGENKPEKALKALEETGLVRERATVESFLDRLAFHYGFGPKEINLEEKDWNSDEGTKYKFQAKPHYRIYLPTKLRNSLCISRTEGEIYAIVVADTECNTLFVSFLPPTLYLVSLTLDIFDHVGSLSSAASYLSGFGIDIINSDKRVIRRKHFSSWRMFVDISRYLEKTNSQESSKEKIKALLLDTFKKERNNIAKTKVVTLYGHASKDYTSYAKDNMC